MSELRELISDRIAASGGWLSFEQFMQMALHEPGLGYYSSTKIPLGRRGDFTTAAETSNLFGRTLARWVATSLPVNGAILELGGGSGKLMASLLGELDAMQLQPQVSFLETSPAMRHLQEETLTKAGFGERCTWLENLPQQFIGIIVAVEVLDAVPCQVFVQREDGWHERGVTVAQEKLVWADGPMTASEKLAPLASLKYGSGYQAEINRQAKALTSSLVASLKEGVLLLVDYGFTASELYIPQRSTGTLTAHYRQQVEPDILARPGEQDITTHIDFSAIAQAGIDAGAQIEGYCTQQAFLLDLGITELAQANEGASEVEVYAISQQLQTMLMPQEMGEIFKVLALGKNSPSPLAGFALNDRSSVLAL